MTLLSKTYWAGAPFSFRQSPDNARVESVELLAADGARPQALLWTPQLRRTRIAVVCIHPRVDFTRHYTIPRLLEAGIVCLGANTRHPNNDIDTVHEDILLDVGACVSYLKDRDDIDHVVLLGNSGGGSLCAMYQAQATCAPANRIARDPAGFPTRLQEADMPPADALILVSAHRGQGQVMNQCIDPAVIDENDAMRTDLELDMYAPSNGYRPAPEWSQYAGAFVERYRQAQLARVRRIDDRARELLAQAYNAKKQLSGGADLSPTGVLALEQARHFQPVIVVYRTMANLHYVDNRLDPSNRSYGSLLSDRPALMNYQRLGFGRVCSPRAWLSTWSGHSSNADLVKNLADVDVPVLAAFAGADREIFPQTDVEPIRRSITASDTTFRVFPTASHYFEAPLGQSTRPDTESLLREVVAWLQERFC